MKTTIKTMALAAIMMLMPLMARAAEHLLDGMPKSDNIERIFISKTMLRLAGSMVGGGSGVPADIIRSLNYMEVYDLDSKGEVKKAMKAVDEAVKKHDMEIMTEVQDDKNEVMIYGTLSDDEKTVTKLIIVNKDKNDAQVIAMEGKIDIKKVMDMAEKQKSKAKKDDDEGVDTKAVAPADSISLK